VAEPTSGIFLLVTGQAIHDRFNKQAGHDLNRQTRAILGWLGEMIIIIIIQDRRISSGGGADAGGDGCEARLELGVQGAIDFEDERYLSHLLHVSSCREFYEPVVRTQQQQQQQLMRIPRRDNSA
jgi:hypothetical protein